MKVLLLGLMIGSAIAAVPKDLPLSKSWLDPDLKWGPCPEVFPKGCEMAVLHGDPGKEKADVYIKTPTNYEIPSHTHTSPEHITLVNGELKIQYKDQEETMAKAGTYLYGPAKVPHKAKCMEQGPCVLQVVFESKPDAFTAKDF